MFKKDQNTVQQITSQILINTCQVLLEVFFTRFKFINFTHKYSKQ
ncbi:MAG: hypothetical protein JWM14_771 [Chitinophagaceae bacterium]|nr:hypothetical protein [Chitinophagaceae bacterium]